MASGAGYHSREIESFGSPLFDQEGNRDLFEEQVDIIFKAFNEDSFSHHGKNYTIPPSVPYRGYQLEEITLVPRPLRLPVECWQPIQSATPRGLDFMAKHGIKGIIGGGVAEGGAMHRVIEAFQAAVCSYRRGPRTRRKPQLRLPLLPVRQQGKGDKGGSSPIRGKPEDVRPLAPRARAERRAD